MKSVITFQNLTLRYPGKQIFSDFSESITEGEFIGILGANGAGKSTLLRAILGLIKPASGNIMILKHFVHRGCSHVGYVPQLQQHLQNNKLSGRAYIASALRGFCYGLPLYTKEQKDEIERVIALVNAKNYIDRPFVQLSGGERKRVALAQALLNQPKILLLDEFLNGLDPGQQRQMVDLIQTLSVKLNMTVLFTAHDLNPFLKVISRIIYLAAGKVAMGDVNEIVTSEKLSWLYGSTIDVVQSKGQYFVVMN